MMDGNDLDRPLVAVTTGLNDEAGSHRRPQITLYGAYVDALERCGAAAVLITPTHSTHTARALVSRCQGLVLSGGGDVDPARYGEERRPETSYVSAGRDAVEFAALEAALSLRIPVLGICRGIQVLNVFMGGTLYQDINAQLPGALEHEQTEAWDRPSQDLRIVEGSRLRGLFDGQPHRINSFHHQGIKDLADGLEVMATTADGLVEAVAAPDHPWLVGVQWHPERHETDTPGSDPDLRLFAAFADAARACGSGS